MNENEIKDLTNIQKKHCDNTPDEDCVGVDCNECVARALINAGYRRVGEDEIVIKKREYDTLLKSYTLTYDNAYQWGLKVGEEKTAIEILQHMKDNIELVDFGCGAGEYEVVDIDTEELKELAKAYGIELEDKDNDDK